MKYNKEIYGIEGSVDIEVMEGGIVEIMTDAPKSRRGPILKLDKKGLGKLIDSLIEAKDLLSKGE